MQLDIAVEMNDFKLVINTFNSIGLVHVRTKDYHQALEYFEKALIIIEQAKTEDFNLTILQLILKQYSLIGEAYLKLNNYEMSRSYFEQQLEFSNKLFNEYDKNNNIGLLDEYALQEFINLLNLALIESKSKNFRKSIEYNERCLESLQSNSNFDLDNKNLSSLIRQQVLELYGRAYIGLVNGYLCVKDNLRAVSLN
jgi:tetratricopeptide (TPR) repeat protein